MNVGDAVVDSLARMRCVLIALDREAKVKMGSLVRSSNALLKRWWTSWLMVARKWDSSVLHTGF